VDYACGVTRPTAGKHKLNKNRTSKIRVFTHIILSDDSVRAGLKTRPTGLLFNDWQRDFKKIKKSG
jgi:hypothetical protein